MSAVRPHRPQDLALVDALKALACCLIVLHHLAFYGPMADHAAVLFPTFFAVMADPARMAVQVFLVLGGFLAMRSLQAALEAGSRAGVEQGTGGLPGVARRLAQRYLRLAAPLWIALAAAVAANALADHWMDHPSIGSAPQPGQVLAHLLLLQDLTGHEALSAGVWYVAIDFQLYGLMLLMVAAASHTRRPAAVLGAGVLVLVALSAVVFNRNAAWDALAPYHAAAYGLGVLVALEDRQRRVDASPHVAQTTLLLAVGLVVLALLVDFRPRLLIALATAILLWAWLRRGALDKPSVGPAVRGLSRISYSVFLIHFPVCLVVNAAWAAHLPASAWLQLLGFLTAFKLSLLAGFAFNRWVEQPLNARLLHRRRTHPSGCAA